MPAHVHWAPWSVPIHGRTSTQDVTKQVLDHFPCIDCIRKYTATDITSAVKNCHPFTVLLHFWSGAPVQYCWRTTHTQLRRQFSTKYHNVPGPHSEVVKKRFSLCKELCCIIARKAYTDSTPEWASTFEDVLRYVESASNQRTLQAAASLLDAQYLPHTSWSDHVKRLKLTLN